MPHFTGSPAGGCPCPTSQGAQLVGAYDPLHREPSWWVPNAPLHREPSWWVPMSNFTGCPAGRCPCPTSQGAQLVGAHAPLHREPSWWVPNAPLHRVPSWWVPNALLHRQPSWWMPMPYFIRSPAGGCLDPTSQGIQMLLAFCSHIYTFETFSLCMLMYLGMCCAIQGCAFKEAQ